MSTGNKPTPALQYPSLGSLATKMLPAEKGVPPYVTFNDFRSGASQSGYLGTAYNPFIIEGAAGGKVGKGAAAGSLRVRGIQLPTGFTLDELENRDKLLQGFDKTFRSADKSADLVDGDARALRHRRFRPGCPGGPAVGGSGRPLRHHQPRRLGHAW